MKRRCNKLKILGCMENEVSTMSPDDGPIGWITHSSEEGEVEEFRWRHPVCCLETVYIWKGVIET